MGQNTNLFRIAPLARPDPAREAQVEALWTREGGLPPDEARRRLAEVLLVATAGDGEVAGVCTAYLARSRQLGMDLWHLRTLVAAGHRGGELAVRLIAEARDHLGDRFARGEDRRAPGAVVEVEHPGLRRRLVDAVWPRTGFAFVGEGAGGDHLRVRWFPGALAPPPPGASAATIAALPGPAPDWSTEVVRGRLDDGWAERLLRFWTANGALDEEAGRRRLPEVVAVLLDDRGELAGVSSAFPADVAMVGGRRFWVFRSFVLPAAAEGRPALVAQTFAALEAEFDPAGHSPIGLCLFVEPEEALRRPEAEWTDPRLLYAGYLDDGRQVRIGYFDGASIALG